MKATKKKINRKVALLVIVTLLSGMLPVGTQNRRRRRDDMGLRVVRELLAGGHERGRESG